MFLEDILTYISRYLNDIDYLFFMLSCKNNYILLNNKYIFNFVKRKSKSLKLKNACYYGLDYIKLIESENFIITHKIIQNLKSVEQLKYFKEKYILSDKTLYISGDKKLFKNINKYDSNIIYKRSNNTLWIFFELPNHTYDKNRECKLLQYKSTNNPKLMISNRSLKYFEKYENAQKIINFFICVDYIIPHYFNNYNKKKHTK